MDAEAAEADGARMNPTAAIEGQRPGNKPAQGNALGTASHIAPALKGRDTIVRNILCRPFRADSFILSFLGRCPGLACCCTFGAQSPSSG